MFPCAVLPYAIHHFKCFLIHAKMGMFKVVCARYVLHPNSIERNEIKKRANILLYPFSNVLLWTFSRLERLWTSKANQIDVVCIAHSHLDSWRHRVWHTKVFLFALHNVHTIFQVRFFFVPHCNFVFCCDSATRTKIPKKTPFVRHLIMGKT